jgi:N-acyl-D-amino-acid deacylase
VKVHFSHYRTNAPNAGQVAEIMADIDRAKSEGVDITLECYPYPVGSSFPLTYFHGKFHEGGPKAILQRLTDPAERAKYVRQIEEKNREAGMAENSWTYIGVDSHRHLEGMYFRDVAAQRGVSIAEMICQVLVETQLKCGFRGAPPQSSRLWRQVEEDVMSLLSRPDYMIGSDSIPLGSVCHPRAYGTFPRVVGRLRRRLGYSLEQVVQRVTQNPAERFQLKGRGVLRKGNFADVVVFDADRISDLSSFEDPRVHPAGIPFVIVNGKVAVDHERCTGVLAGEAL